MNDIYKRGIKTAVGIIIFQPKIRIIKNNYD